MHDEGQFWKRADEVLIAEPDPTDLERDTYQEWLEKHDIDRTDPRLRSLRVQLRTSDDSPKPQKYYLLPANILKSLLEREPLEPTVERTSQTGAAVSEAVSVWADAEVDRCLADYREAAAANGHLGRLKLWHRVDTVHRLVQSLGTEADLAAFERTLDEQGLPADEPHIDLSEGDVTEGRPDIDLRQPAGIGSQGIGSQLRTSGRSLLSKGAGFGRRRGGSP